MSTSTVYRCDVCKRERQDANHWFIGGLTILGVAVHAWAYAVEEGLLDNPETRHLCGQECVHKFVDAFISNRAARIAENT